MPLTPEPAVVIPTHSCAVPQATKLYTATKYNTDIISFHQYNEVLELGRKIIQTVYPLGDNLIDLEDEYSNIDLETKAMLDQLSANQAIND